MCGAKTGLDRKAEEVRQMPAWTRNLVGAVILGSAIILAPVPVADAQVNLGDGLVNVQVGRVTILQNVTIDAAVAAVVQLCPSVSVQNVALLASQVDQRGSSTQAFCRATSGAATGPVRIANNG
jgi:hypothetical protein